MNNKNTKSKIIFLISLVFIIVVKLCPPPSGLSEAGFEVLGILVVAIMLFLGCGIGWTSMYIVLLLMTVPGLSVSQVTQATFGNNTAIFLLFCFMLAACLTESGIAKRIAIWFLTNKLARKNPWWTVAMYFAAVYVLDLFLSSATCIMIMLPILTQILDSVKIGRNEKNPLASLLLMSTVCVGLLSNGTNPISHAVTTQGFSLYESYSGEAMDLFTFAAATTPISIACVLALYFLARFVWKPDVSSFAKIDYDALADSCGPITKREKWSLGFYLACVFFWLLPGLSKYIWPSAYQFFSRINNCMPPLAALFLMNFIKIDGEKILDWNTAVKACNWPSYMFIATIMGLGSFMGKEELGISAWLSGQLAPLFTSISPLVFVLIMVAIVDILTNFCSNSVALSVVFSVALPLCLTVYQNTLSPMLVAVLITNSAMNGWATSPASPTAAVAYSTGWADEKQILKWGLTIMFVHIVFCMVIGVPLMNLLT